MVLVAPKIAPNTGNVGRTCVGLGLSLWLVGELGFRIDDAKLRRAGLDYWPKLDLHIEPDEAAFRARLARRRPVLFTKRATRSVFDTDLTAVDALVFGSETEGLSDAWFELGLPTASFPQSQHIRSYNLAATVHSACMEWVRQTGYRVETL